MPGVTQMWSAGSQTQRSALTLSWWQGSQVKGHIVIDPSERSCTHTMCMIVVLYWTEHNDKAMCLQQVTTRLHTWYTSIHLLLLTYYGSTGAILIPLHLCHGTRIITLVSLNFGWLLMMISLITASFCDERSFIMLMSTGWSSATQLASVTVIR